MKKALISLVALGALVGGCTGQGKRFWELVDTMKAMNSYESSPEEKREQLREFREDLERARKIAEKNLGSDYQKIRGYNP